jgi:hypothetical protein
MNNRPASGTLNKDDPVRWSALAMALIGPLLLAMRSSDVLADDRVCELVIVDASPNLDPVWLGAMSELRATLAHELTGRECVPVEIRLEASPVGVIVRARSADGRETSRPVKDPRALVPVVLGLLATAPVEPVPPTETVEGHAPEPAVRTSLSAPAESSPGPINEAPSAVRVGLGLSTGIRAGVPTDVAMWDNELRFDVLLHDWILLANMRYAFLGIVKGIALDSDAYEEIAVGFGAGRELRWGRNTLDLTASPSVVFVNLEKDTPVEVSGERAQVRIGVAARYGHALGLGWKFTITLDTEVAPSSLIRNRHVDPDLPPIPAWTAGLRFGAEANLL